MFFILSKVLFIFLVPFWWMIILFIWMKFSKNQKTKKRLLISIFVIGVTFSNPYLFNTAARFWQPAPTELHQSKKFELGILLAGLASHDIHNHWYFGGSADRFIQTANLYHKGIIKKILVSGGDGTLEQKSLPEAEFLKTELMANGITDADIFIDNQSRNTYENAICSKRIIDSLQLKPPYVLITSAIHMRRSLALYHKAGLNEIIPYPCDYKAIESYYTPGNTVFPNISLLKDWSFLLKEIVGLYVYKLSGKA